MTKSQWLSKSVRALEITAFVIAPLLLLLAYLSQSTIREYRQNGVSVQARVISKEKGSSQLEPYCIKVGFFDKSILEGGTLYMPEICELVSGPVWASYEPDDDIAIVFLPEDPEGKAILQDALDPANLALIHKYVTGLVVLAAGGILAALYRVIENPAK
jgi:hypothetical protein